MAEEGIDLSAEIPKVLTVDAVRESDVVITMGCGDACPVFPGKRYEDWDLDDPAGRARSSRTTDPRRDPAAGARPHGRARCPTHRRLTGAPTTRAVPYGPHGTRLRRPLDLGLLAGP